MRTFLAFFLLLMFIASGCKKEESGLFFDEEAQAYLEEYLVPFRLSDIELAEPDRLIFLTGESHGTAANYALEFAFLQYFVTNHSLQYYLIENTYGFAGFINQYLETGDEQILRDLFDALRQTAAQNQDHFRHWQRVRAFYRSLPEEQRFRVIGIDIEHQLHTGIRYLASLLPTRKAPDQLQPLVETLGSLAASSSFSDSEIHTFSRQLETSLAANQAAWVQYLEQAFFDFDFTNRNIRQRIVAYDEREVGSMSFLRTREEFICQNFTALRPRLTEGTFFGQWGSQHVYQRPLRGVNWLGACLQENVGFRDRIVSIHYAYENCQTRLSDQRIKPLHSVIPNELLRPESNLTLYPLDKSGSPFGKRLINLLESFPESAQGVTTDYYQYLLLIRNSEAVAPYEE